MKTLQEKYNAILEGNFSKTQFVRDARLAHSNLITQFNSFADTVAILKNKGMVVEAKKAEVTAYKKPEVDPIDMVAPDLLDHGIEAELHAAGITGTPSEEEYAKAKEKAAKELIKDPLCYKNAQMMTEPGEKMEKAKLNEGSKENHQRTSLVDRFAEKEIASALAEKPVKVSKAFRKMALKPQNLERYKKMSQSELITAFNKFKLEENYEDEEEGSGYSYGEYKEGNGASPEEIQGKIDFYQEKPDVWSMVAKKDFEKMADGKSADIKKEHYPEWKKEDFVEVLNALTPVEITERLSPEAHARMEGSLNLKAINTFIEAAGTIIKDLKKEDFEEDDIFEFLIDRLLTLESMTSAVEIDKAVISEEEYIEGPGADEREIEKHATEFYIYQNSQTNSGKIAYNTKLKDFTALAKGETPEIKNQLFPTWKKEDFKKLINTLKPVKIDEKQFRREQGLEEQETQLKEAIKSLIKKTLES